MSELLELKDKTLIDLLLEEQGQVDTPVGRFAEAAEANEGEAPFQGLIPLSAPRRGEQFAFEVNLDKCSGCKGCVTACHSLNGLDENETWRDVGLLVGGSALQPFQQTVTTACHHCVDPACLIGCPVDAYEKDPVSGIVLHLDDQCIGCQYCVLKCPYDVPKYSAKRGIVRKCDMCHSRLSVGEAPACVQACPHEAIKITTVKQEEARVSASSEGGFLADCPDPDYTVPTTRYVSKKELPDNLLAADKHVLRPQHAHYPLVGLLALSQIGIGGFAFAAFDSGSATSVPGLVATAVSWLLLHVGLLCSVLHLGQPLKAWRVFLGFRRSWLSREAVVLGGVSGLSSVVVGLQAYGLWFEQDLVDASALLRWALPFTALVGLVGVFTSVYIYVDTKRSFWRLPYSGAKFYGSALLGALGIGSVAAAMRGDASVGVFAALVGVSGLVKLAVEFKARADNPSTLGMSKGPLASLWRGRIALGLLASVLLPGLLFVFPSVLLASVMFVALIAGELLERVFYFKAVNAPKMPGSITI